ncbi:sigma-54-dependent transcriptional regulator [Planctomicrobium piriforme]|uniref:DNA-binding transcriptional regulator NtrC n=1 Tax=Planctomicrobium piriforme TaxID=1576369 RepID=A0A1I3E9Z7_9PLAN|nr:sigma-54 dependent transcriptional regulator [Planctomicrobium piriforme]SFH95784.1 two-component system, NtrC family, nitrogen regulation response regulator GlnG [Planctomicrobium piriforme]
MIAKLLVIDDEPNIVFSIKECLQSDTLQVISAGSAREGIGLASSAKPDVVILDVRLPDLSGLDAYDRIAQLDPRLPVIIVTAYASTETAIEAMRRGAFEYLVKPVDIAQLESVVNKALEVSRLSRVPAVVGKDVEDTSADRIIGQSTPMQEVYKAIGRTAPQEGPVLILGESGTGKELVARAIYHYSRRSQKPFLAINCAALPETLLESELFGHEAGAFTGADQRRIGKFEQVNGGTIFLDEIGDMSLATQAKALRLIQEQAFQRLGGTQTVQTNVRIIAATNQNLPKLIENGDFRLDLYYRLNVFAIPLPPLRERREDLPLLVDHFFKKFNRETGRRVHSITPETLQILQAYDWPGNVRELESTVRFAMVRSTGDIITPDCLPANFTKGRPVSAAVLAAPAAAVVSGFDVRSYVRSLLEADSPDIYRQVSDAVDRIVLEEVMQQVDGNQVQACKKLGIARMTLRNKLRSLDMLGEGHQDPDAGH